jgi:hypothetical protein
MEGLDGSNPFAPALDRAIAFIHERIPGHAAEIELALADQGITTGSFRIEGIVKAGQIFGREVPFAITAVGDKRVVTSLAAEGLIDSIRQTARKSVEHWGATTVSDVTAQVNDGSAYSADEHFVGGVVAMLDGFRWLDESGGWFWLTDVKTNRMRNQIEKILAVAGEITVSELRAGVGRHHRMQGFAPPQRVLLELCRQLSGFSVDGSMVRAHPPLGWRRALQDTEATMVEVLCEHGPVMKRSRLEELCLERGMNRSTFYVYLGYSPVIAHYARGVYGLRGSHLPPGLVDSLAPARRQGRVLVDYGWAKDGRVWLGYRLSTAMLSSGVLGAPAEFRDFLEGEFALRDHDGTNVGTLVFKSTSGAWGLGRFFRRRGGEPGDYLLIECDLSSRQATVSIGDASLFERMNSADQHE